MGRKLLIDADIIAYEVAASHEVGIEDEDGFVVSHVDLNEAKADIKARIDHLMAAHFADEYVLCLTDSASNFRKSILPTYKGNRIGVRKPMALKHIRRWMLDDLGAVLRPGLEGDDCIGILATKKEKSSVDRLMISIDKDLQSVPGLLSRDGIEVIEITLEQADRFHMLQTLTGDQTDGYSGCPGIGAVRAEKILKAAGENPWPAVVAAYEKAGLSEDDALVQARVARILRATDYDFKTKEVKLWIPSR